MLLDTHIWIWLVNNSGLPSYHRDYILSFCTTGLAVSVMSCWEVAKLVEKDRLGFEIPVREWINNALAFPGVYLTNFTPDIALLSCELPGSFHKDPADQIIVATAITQELILATADSKIVEYEYVSSYDCR